jgi:hypothetical protein
VQVAIIYCNICRVASPLIIAAKAGHLVVVRLLIEWMRNMNLHYCIDEGDVTGLGSLVFIHEISPQLC